MPPADLPDAGRPDCPNPPGVGDAGTLQARQALYFAAMLLGALGALGMLASWRYLSRLRADDWLTRSPWALPLAGRLP